MFFANRCDAGRRLAAELEAYRAQFPLVLGLPRGGIPVAYEVAHALGAALDVLVVRKLGAPGQPELAIGAVAAGVTVLDHETILLLAVPDDYVTGVRERETRALAELDQHLRGDVPFPDVRGRVILVVDDGIATGATARAAVDTLTARGASLIVVAAPVAAPEAIDKLRARGVPVVVVTAPPDFAAVGYWYADFTPTSDVEVQQLLKRARLEHEARFRPPPP